MDYLPYKCSHSWTVLIPEGIFQRGWKRCSKCKEDNYIGGTASDDSYYASPEQPPTNENPSDRSDG